jgi:hypothetical protein
VTMMNELTELSQTVGLSMNIEDKRLSSHNQGRRAIEYVENVCLGQIISPNETLSKELERKMAKR